MQFRSDCKNNILLPLFILLLSNTGVYLSPLSVFLKKQVLPLDVFGQHLGWCSSFKEGWTLKVLTYRQSTHTGVCTHAVWLDVFSEIVGMNILGYTHTSLTLWFKCYWSILNFTLLFSWHNAAFLHHFIAHKAKIISWSQSWLGASAIIINVVWYDVFLDLVITHTAE